MTFEMQVCMSYAMLPVRILSLHKAICSHHTDITHMTLTLTSMSVTPRSRYKCVCRFRGVSKKKGKWEAKVMVNRKWAYRELFDSEEEAARAYDGAVWRLKPKEAKSYVNFKERPGQASTKLAKAARLIERAQAK